MPAGVEVVIADGFATIDFVDKAKRGPGLAMLLKRTPAVLVEKLTRSGPRVLYRVPEGNVRAAGLLDKASRVAALEKPETSSARDATGVVPPKFPTSRNLHAQVIRHGTYSTAYAQGGLIEAPNGGDDSEAAESAGDEEPSAAWSRKELDAYAAAHGIDTSDLPNKAAALAAIRRAS